MVLTKMAYIRKIYVSYPDGGIGFKYISLLGTDYYANNRKPIWNTIYRSSTPYSTYRPFMEIFNIFYKNEIM